VNNYFLLLLTILYLFIYCLLVCLFVLLLCDCLRAYFCYQLIVNKYDATKNTAVNCQFPHISNESAVGRSTDDTVPARHCAAFGRVPSRLSVGESSPVADRQLR